MLNNMIVACLFLLGLADTAAEDPVYNVTASGTEYTTTKLVYSKYFSKRGGSTDNECASYYINVPTQKNSGRVPIVLEWHGGGFTGGAATMQCNRECEAMLDNGIAFASMDYRLVTTKYYYCEDGSMTCKAPKEEEFIHADASGNLTLDTTGKVMSDYKVRIGRQEYNTKCSFDAGQALEHLLSQADTHNIDVHRIATTGGSAGGGEINYLTYVYHALGNNAERYTPVGMVYTMAQLDYPVQNMLDKVWSDWAEDVGEDTKLSTILDKGDCSMIIGNPWCEADSKPSQTDVCNQTWHKAAMARYCGDAFESTTLKQLVETQKWPMETEQDRGIATLWYNSVNMLAHTPKPFYLYIANQLNTTAGMNVVHNALYSRNYGKFAQQAGINFTTYYTDYEAMTADDKGTERFAANGRAGSIIYNYRSNFGWLDVPGVRATDRVSPQEQLLFYCHAFGIPDCKASPAPGPGPGPSPPGPAPALSAACKKEIDSKCASAEGKQAACRDCVHTNARDFQAHGCPPAGQEGAARCIAYCTGAL